MCGWNGVRGKGRKERGEKRKQADGENTSQVQRAERCDPLECNEFFFFSCQMMHSGYILIFVPGIYTDGTRMKRTITPVCLLTLRDKGRRKGLNASDRFSGKRGHGAWCI